jgi:GWxTD domain-containing protein
MRMLDAWIANPLAGAVGWTLLHSLWEGAIIAAALMAVLPAMRSSRSRYAVACAALLLTVAAFSITLLRLAPYGERTQGARFAMPAPGWIAAATSASSSRHPGLTGIVPWLTPFWAAGVLAVCMVNVAGFASTRRLRRSGVCGASEYWQNEIGRLSRALRISRPVALMESCLVNVPVTLGHFRPLILMPLGLIAGLAPAHVEAILAHELAHIRRYDYLVNLLQRLAEALLFYHPAVWWVSRTIRIEREHCCDDIAVKLVGSARDYAIALSAVERSRQPAIELAMAATGGSLVERVRRLLYPKGPRYAWTPLLAVVIVLTVAGASLYAWRASPAQNGGTTERRWTPVTSEPSTDATTRGQVQVLPAQIGRQLRVGEASITFLVKEQYSKWLNEDVAYIITDEERAAFLNLRTDEEREKFIKQFWLRRDPTPGTLDNESKIEHYRRIAYANDRFSTPGRPGWQTDRGHMYIVYGPPDQIDDRPQRPGTAEPYQMQIWTYRVVTGIGENASFTFIDRSGAGDLRLAPGTSR